LQQSIEQDARAAALVTVDEHAMGIGKGMLYGLGNGELLEAGVARSIDNPLEAPVARKQEKVLGQIGPIVGIGLRMQQMHAGQIAFAAPGGQQATRAADREKLGPEAAFLQDSKEIIQAGTVTANEHQVRGLKFPP